MFGSLAGLSSTAGEDLSTDVTYESARCLWMQWGLDAVHRSLYVDMELGEEAVAK